MRIIQSELRVLSSFKVSYVCIMEVLLCIPMIDHSVLWIIAS